jgi:hypothetical protein
VTNPRRSPVNQDANLVGCLELARAEAGCTVLNQTDCLVSEALNASHSGNSWGRGIAETKSLIKNRRRSSFDHYQNTTSRL